MPSWRLRAEGSSRWVTTTRVSPSRFKMESVTVLAVSASRAAEAIVGQAATLIVELFPRQLIGIFGAGNESAYYTTFAIKCFCVYLCMMILAMVNKGTFIYLQALGKALLSTIISMTREIILGVFLPIILPVFFGLDGLLYSFPTADILTFLIAVVIIRHTYKKVHGKLLKSNFP